MPSYKITYFNAAGRAEITRLVLVAAGQKFEDKRIEFKDWPALKPTTPWGSIPFIEVDGKKLGQSSAITRYIAHQHGLGGSSHWEQALVDSAVDTALDIWSGINKIVYEVEESQKPTQMKKYKESVAATLTFLEKFIQEHGKDGHVVGHKMSTADIALFNAIDQVQTAKGLEMQDVVDKLPGVKKVVEMVRADAKIAAYLKTRPPGHG